MKIRAISTCGIARLLLSYIHSNNKVKVYVPVRAKLFRLFILFSAECAETERPLTRQSGKPPGDVLPTYNWLGRYTCEDSRQFRTLIIEYLASLQQQQQQPHTFRSRQNVTGIC
jgi:hypothetical protein